MSRVLLRLNGHEANCVYTAVYNELCALEEDLSEGTIAPEDVANAQRSIDTCKNVLSKIVSAAPNSSYVLPD